MGELSGSKLWNNPSRLRMSSSWSFLQVWSSARHWAVSTVVTPPQEAEPVTVLTASLLLMIVAPVSVSHLSSMKIKYYKVWHAITTNQSHHNKVQMAFIQGWCLHDQQYDNVLVDGDWDGIDWNWCPASCISDYDDCNIWGVCDHFCEDRPGTHHCICANGYFLEQGHICRANVSGRGSKAVPRTLLQEHFMTSSLTLSCIH